ncbi:MAG TPA: VWA domain-containing protein [Candidatus Angelobacter sp.]
MAFAFLPLLSAVGQQSTATPDANAQSTSQTTTRSQQPTTDEQRQLTDPAFKVTTRLVVVDVVARDKKDQTINDLEAADFSVKENGREQKISTFNFQHPASAETPATTRSALPSNVFRNAPRFQSNSALNVILLDGLNSTLLNQAYVRVEMVNFLEKLPQGQPIAIYSLGQKLRLLQDFTSDLTELKKVIQTFKGQSSHVLSSPTGTPEVPMTLGGWAEQTLLDKAPQFEAQINSFAQENPSDQMDMRVSYTMAALTVLARTLAGYPGRKNLIWLTESVPVHIFVDNGEVSISSSVDSSGRPLKSVPNGETGARGHRDYSNQLALIANLFADAQVAVYPIDARGLIGSPFYNVASQMSGQSAMGGLATHAEGRQSEELFEAHSNMEDVAEKTGGKAYFNRNDLDKALLGDIDDGSTYYSLGYYPDNKKWDGKFRKIQVTSKRAGVKLRYRLGYFAMDRAEYMRDHPRQRDMELDLALNPNSPVSTALQFAAEVLPPSPETLNKVQVHYAVDPHAISFQRGEDGKEHAELDCAVRVFAPGKIDTPVKSEGTRMNAALLPEAYNKISRTFFPCQLDLELAPGNYFLRLAVRDNKTGLLGAVNAQVTVPPISANAGPKPAEEGR